MQNPQTALRVNRVQTIVKFNNLFSKLISLPKTCNDPRGDTHFVVQAFHPKQGATQISQNNVSTSQK